MNPRMPKLKPESTLLTLREREVVALVADGVRNREIGETLGISEETVKRHIFNAMNKRGMETRVQLAVWWVQHSTAVELEEVKTEIAKQEASLSELRQIESSLSAPPA